MVLRLLEDENIEVIHQAIKLLSGLIHWKIFEIPQELLVRFFDVTYEFICKKKMNY